MAIVSSYPPNYAEILKVFPGAQRPGIIFAYAPNIHAPGNQKIPPDLIAHEMMHIQRQQEIGVEIWWENYLTNPDFRYWEEVLAHRVEYNHLIQVSANRNTRRMALKHVSKKLAATLYKTGITREQAVNDITSTFPVKTTELTRISRELKKENV